tara:strand:+ start:530 stop:943 length:414 start_codon:yes stop_codon:yes gene_type:complete
MTKELEESLELSVDWNKLSKAASASDGLVPVAVQDINTNELILIAYINEIAFKESIRKKMLILWSSSRNELWIKGKTSGNTFDLLEAYINCEQNSFLFKVSPKKKGICHTKNKNGESRNCYYRQINFDTLALKNIDL